ncbi:MAG: hypothetical protein WC175_01095 [Candidatus Dojkabacteria bacterium]
MSFCIFNSAKGKNNFNVMKDMTEAERLLSLLSEGEVGLGATSINEVYHNKTSLIRALVDNENANIEDISIRIESDPEARATFYRNYDSLVKETINLFNEPSKGLAQIDASSRAYKVAKQTLILNRSVSALTRPYHWLLQHTGLDKNVWLQLAGNKLNKVEQFAPSKKAYELFKAVDNFTNSTPGEISAKVNESFNRIYSADVLEKFGLAGRESASNVQLFFDEGYRRSNYGRNLKMDYNNTRTLDAFREHVIPYIKDPDISDHDLSVLFSIGKNFMAEWNTINYGKPVITDDEVSTTEGRRLLMKKAPPGTLMYYMQGVKDYLKTMKAYIDEYSDSNNLEYNAFRRNLADIEAVLDDFTPRKDYIPLKSGDHDILGGLMNKIVDTDDKYREDSYLSRSWRRRRDDADYDNLSIDLMQNIDSILTGTNLLLRDMSNAFLANYLQVAKDKAISSDTNWFKGNAARQEVKYAIEQMINGARRSYNNKKYTNSAVKNITTAMGIIPSMILSLPVSAIKNYLEGTVQMYSRLGSELHGKNFTVAQEENSLVFRMVDEITKKELAGSGIVREYIAHYNEAGEGLKGLVNSTTGKVKDWSMMLADVFGGKGLTSLSATLGSFLTMEGTERRMRMNASRLLYNRIHEDAILSGLNINAMSEGQITKLINKHKTQVMYDMNNALGDFHPMNKPFTYHLLKETAENQRQLLGGIALSWTYMFRHAGVVTAENFLYNATKLISDKTLGIKRTTANSKRQQGLALGQIGFVLGSLITTIYNMIADGVNDFNEDEDPMPQFKGSLMRVLEPLDEYAALTKLTTYGVALAFFDGKMSEGMFEQLKNTFLDTGLDASLGIVGSGLEEPLGLKDKLDLSLVEDIVKDGSPVNILEAITDLQYIDIEGDNEYDKLSNMKKYFYETSKSPTNKVVKMLKPINLVRSIATGIAVDSDDDKVDADFNRFLVKDFIVKAFVPSLWHNQKIRYNPNEYYDEYDYGKSYEGAKMKYITNLYGTDSVAKRVAYQGYKESQASEAYEYYLRTGYNLNLNPRRVK